MGIPVRPDLSLPWCKSGLAVATPFPPIPVGSGVNPYGFPHPICLGLCLCCGLSGTSCGGLTGKEVKRAAEFMPLNQEGHCLHVPNSLLPPAWRGVDMCPGFLWTWSGTSRSSYGVLPSGQEGRRNAYVLSSCFGLSGIRQNPSLTSHFPLKLAQSLNEYELRQAAPMCSGNMLPPWGLWMHGLSCLSWFRGAATLCHSCCMCCETCPCGRTAAGAGHPCVQSTTLLPP